MDKAVAEELCKFLDDLSLFVTETYQKAQALERMTEEENFTKEAFRQAEGRTDAVVRLESLSAHVAELREALHLSPTARPTLPEKPAAPDLSFLED